MKTKNTSLLLLSLLLSLSALRAVPTDPGSSTDPSNPASPALPTPPSSKAESRVLTLADSGTTHNISLSDTNNSYIEISLPVSAASSWCYVENVPAANGLLPLSYTPITYSYIEDPEDASKVKMAATSDWVFALVSSTPGSSITLSFYARDYDGMLFPEPFNQVYTFTFNITQ